MASVFIRERRGQFKHRDMETHREVGQSKVGQRLEGGGGKPGSGSHERLRAGEKSLPQSLSRQLGLADSGMADSILENYKGKKCLLFCYQFYGNLLCQP